MTEWSLSVYKVRDEKKHRKRVLLVIRFTETFKKSFYYSISGHMTLPPLTVINQFSFSFVTCKTLKAVQPRPPSCVKDTKT